MALWKEQTPVKKDAAPNTATVPNPQPAPTPAAVSFESTKREEPRFDVPATGLDTGKRGPVKESIIASELTIEGKIEGTGHVRIAGRFKGDVNVQGNLTIESGAKVTGGVRANTVAIAGELEGNISDASKVELNDTGILIGDLKAGTLTVAAGSKMRGHAEFGWETKGGRSDNGSTP